MIEQMPSLIHSTNKVLHPFPNIHTFYITTVYSFGILVPLDPNCNQAKATHNQHHSLYPAPQGHVLLGSKPWYPKNLQEVLSPITVTLIIFLPFMVDFIKCQHPLGNNVFWLCTDPQRVLRSLLCSTCRANGMTFWDHWQRSYFSCPNGSCYQPMTNGQIPLNQTLYATQYLNNVYPLCSFPTKLSITTCIRIPPSLGPRPCLAQQRRAEKTVGQHWGNKDWINQMEINTARASRKGPIHGSKRFRLSFLLLGFGKGLE